MFSTFFSNYAFIYRDFSCFYMIVFKVVCCRFIVCGKRPYHYWINALFYALCRKLIWKHCLTLSHKQQICSRRLWNYQVQNIEKNSHYEQFLFPEWFQKSSAAEAPARVFMTERFNEFIFIFSFYGLNTLVESGNLWNICVN